MTQGPTQSQSHEKMQEEKLLRFWLNQGWAFRMRRHSTHMKAHRAEYISRVESELSLILEKDFASYFLVVSDLVRWAKDNKIVVGPARGSSGASLVAWLLRITEVNPMLFPHMLFSRFIEPTRTDNPDIDVDIEDERRRELWDYAEAKYGADRVGNIGNVVKYRGKNSIDDVARAFQIPKWAAEAVKENLIIRGDGDARNDETVEDTFASSGIAQQMLEQFPDLRYAGWLEGNVRGLSIHAAGMVLSNDPITDTCATYADKSNDTKVIPYDKRDADYLGMLKIDLLGLSTMGAISLALNWIGLDMEDMYALSLDDPEVMSVFTNIDLVGIFQFEGAATRFICREVEPEHFGHLADISALSRPGALASGTKDMYVAAKRQGHNTAIHPALEPITGWTYGQIVYQEQILAVLREIGGMSDSDVHAVRKIIGKKLGEAQFNQLFSTFADGAKRTHDMDSDVAARIWRLLTSSANYSFVHAHAVAYTIISYWCAWMKHYHPTAFYAGMLCRASTDKQHALLMDAMRHGIKILPPDPAISEANWAPEGDNLRAGLLALPKCGPEAAKKIIAWREGRGRVSFDDLIDVQRVGKTSIENWKAFVAQDDPFGLNWTRDVMAALRDFLGPGNDSGMPTPTHRSDEIPRDDKSHENIVFAGIPRKKKYGDLIEDERTKTGDSTEDIQARIRDPHLTRRCYVECFDDREEDVRLRFNRWIFPDFEQMLETVKCDGTQAIVAVGTKRPDFGVGLHVKRMHLIDLVQ